MERVGRFGARPSRRPGSAQAGLAGRSGRGDARLVAGRRRSRQWWPSSCRCNRLRWLPCSRSLPPASAIWLVQMSPSELDALGQLLDGLEPERRNQLVLALLNNPNAMDIIVREGAGRAILASRDLPAAIAFLDTPADGYSIVTDGISVANGSVSLRLFGRKVRRHDHAADRAGSTAAGRRDRLFDGEPDGSTVGRGLQSSVWTA